MTYTRNQEAKTFIAKTLLGLNANQAEWLAVIIDQIAQLGRYIEAEDKQMYEKILDHLVSHEETRKEMLIKHRNKR